MSSATTTPASGPARLLAAAERLAAFERLSAFVRAGRAAGSESGIGVRGLAGSAGAWLAAALHARAGGTMLWIAEDGEKAEEAREDLEHFLGHDRVLPFPEPETLPYDGHSPHPAVTAQRLETLAALARGESGVVVTTVRALAQKVLSPERLVSHELSLQVDQDYERDELVARLVGLGYERVPIVSSLGQFSVRGGMMDLFSLGSEDPWRLEFDGDTLSSLRRFDPLSQRSVENMARATVLPRYEIALSPGEAAEVLERLSRAGDRAAEAAARDGRDLERMTSELFFEGMERVAGHYGQDLVPLWTYLPGDTVVWLEDPDRLKARGERLDDEVQRFHGEAVAHFPLISPPDELFTPWADTLKGAGPRVLALGPIAHKGDPKPVLEVSCAPQPAFTRSLDLVRGFMSDLNGKGHELVVLCDNTGQRDRLGELLGATPAMLDVGLLTHGFTCAEA